MDQASLSRRSLLQGSTGIAALAATVGVAPAAQGSGTPRGLSAPMQALVTAYQAAERRADHYSATVAEPARAAYRKAIAAIPHVETSAYSSTEGRLAKLSTESEQSVTSARALLRLNLSAPESPGTYLAAARELIQGADWRNAECDRLLSAHAIKAVNAREDELGEAAWTRRWEVIEHPSSCLADLSAKLTAINRTDAWNCEDAQAAIVADVERLATGGLA